MNRFFAGILMAAVVAVPAFAALKAERQGAGFFNEGVAGR